MATNLRGFWNPANAPARPKLASSVPPKQSHQRDKPAKKSKPAKAKKRKRAPVRVYDKNAAKHFRSI